MVACYGGTDVMERSCAVARGIDINKNAPKWSNSIPKWPNFKIFQNYILIARSKKLEQGNLLSQPAPFIFFICNTTPPFFRCLTASAQLKLRK
jgi:hypothetical protein